MWCEDYLRNAEHKSAAAPQPIIRSFLIPLANAGNMLDVSTRMARPLDRDRGAGQFGSYGNISSYDEAHLAPLVDSLVSFVLDAVLLQQQETVLARGELPRQLVLPMALLQQHLTGHWGSPVDLASRGIAAQHGRGGHQADLAPDYKDALSASYEAVTVAGFRDPVQTEAPRLVRNPTQFAVIDPQRFPCLRAELERRQRETRAFAPAAAAPASTAAGTSPGATAAGGKPPAAPPDRKPGS